MERKLAGKVALVKRIGVKTKLIAFGLPCILGGGALLANAPGATRPVPGILSDGLGALESEYLAENDRAMTKMMRDMDIRPTGDVDRDFVAQMIPHHQGAIDMAGALLHAGRNEVLKRLAQEIIVTQKSEIAAMLLAVGESPSGLERPR